MSGHPYRYASDIANFRSDYMDQLNLKATIDDMNLKANQVYKASGQLPPQSSMPDTRTTAEKLADSLRLKVSLVAELKPIAGPQFAQEVIQEVEKSNLNSNGSLFIFFAQNVKEIVRNLQKKYALGIVGNANDALNFRLFIEKMYNDTKELTGSVQSAFNRPYNSSKSVNLSDLTQMKQIYDELRVKILTKFPNINRQGRQVITSIYEIMEAITQLVPNREILKQMIDQIINNPHPLGGVVADRDRAFRAHNDLEKLLIELPLIPSVYSVYEHLKKSLLNNNPELTLKTLIQLRDMFPSLQTVQRIQGEINALNLPPAPPAGGAPAGGAPVGGAPAGGAPAGGAPAGGAPAGGAPVIGIHPAMGGQPALDMAFMPDVPPAIPYQYHQGYADDGAPAGGAPEMSDAQIRRELDRINREFFHLHNRAEGGNYDPEEYHQIIQLLRDVPNAQDERLIRYKNTIFGDVTDELQRLEGRGGGGGGGDRAGGNGIKRGRGRPKGSGISHNFQDKVDTNKGIQPDRRYISFGKYLINNSKLNEGTVSLRTPKGVNVIGYPSQRVTPQLSNVFKKIVGGGVPSFKELNDLNDNERNYLYNVSKKAEILDKLSIPSPSKDQEDRDIHDFQVMKGEILSGNDNKDLIKKFKIHMSKMVRSGALPKKEVADIMTDLIELGF